MITHTALAKYLIQQPPSQRRKAIRQVAAWLVSTRQSRRSGEVTLEVARLQGEQGHVWAQVTTARPISADSEKRVKALLKRLGADSVEIENQVDPIVVGGIRVDTPTHRLDATVASKLDRFVQRSTG